MPNRSTDELFQLIKSLEKSEKRNFKLFVKRMGGDADLKIVQLFDALEKINEYDDEVILKKITAIKRQQLPNLKAHLYKQILASLRAAKEHPHIEMQLYEQLSYARILYSKGLYLQSLKILDKAKQAAISTKQSTFVFLVLDFEKKIEALHVTRSIENRAELLSVESEKVIQELEISSQLANLSLRLYSWYTKLGHARDEKDTMAIKLFFEANLPVYDVKHLSFYEKMYLYQSYTWYNFILQDLRMFYRYTQKWLDLFEAEPVMKSVEPVQYIKALHNLLNAHFDTNNYSKFEAVLKQFEDFATSSVAEANANTRIQSFVYLSLAQINKHFLRGTFTDGIKLVPAIEEKLEEYALHLDGHRIMIFYYKIACLYFGSGDNEKAIDYLNKIINQKYTLRIDLQCYARLLHLIAHYELGNYNLLEYLIKSVYRFMANMKNLSVVEEEIFKFLRRSFTLSRNKIIPAFKALKATLEKYERNPLETRSFMYLDIIAWLESKIQNIPVQQVRRMRYMSKMKKSQI